MATTVATVPQPLSGDEIRKGIAVRMTHGLPAEYIEPLREQIEKGLLKTCSLTAASAYSKFSADWWMTYWKSDSAHCCWWIDANLDDFGRVTPISIGHRVLTPSGDPVTIKGHIDEAPPDRFRRETDQPIPKPIELKKSEEQTQTFSKSMRGKGKRRNV